MNRDNLGLLVLVFVVSGCVTSRTSIPSIGVRVGDKMRISEGAVVTSCELELSTTSLLSGGKRATTCLEPKEKGDTYRALPRYEGKGNFVIEEILYRNGVDTTFHLIQVKDADSDSLYWVYDFNMDKLFGVRRSP